MKHLEKHQDRLDADAKRRMHTNPLRTLDSKNPMVQEVVASAPALLQYLGDASLAHFDGLKRLLTAAGIEYEVNAKLVRGLDYYNLTVFEWISPALGAQGTVCGGGRYDGLFAQIGGKPAPATGFAMGNERLIALLQDAARKPALRPPHGYVIHQGEGTLEHAFKLAETLRSNGLRVVLHAGGGGFKSQMKRADASGARYAVIIGEDELKAGEVSVKPLRTDQPQFRVRRDAVAPALQEANGARSRRAGKVEELKAWWRQHGGFITAIVRAVALAFAGWQAWRWYQASQASQASVLYDTVAKAAQANDAKALRDAAGTLVENYPRTLYASMGALVAARYYFDRNDLKTAKAQLQWVIERAPSDDFKHLARLRLAAVLLDEKAYDEALKLLDAKPAAAYEAQYAALRGDILLAKNQAAEARPLPARAREVGQEGRRLPGKRAHAARGPRGMSPVRFALVWLPALALSGCTLFSSPSGPKPVELQPLERAQEVRVLWTANVGRADRFAFSPAAVGESIYAAGRDGTVVRLDAANGNERWRVSVERQLSGGVGADPARRGSDEEGE